MKKLFFLLLAAVSLVLTSCEDLDATLLLGTWETVDKEETDEIRVDFGVVTFFEDGHAYFWDRVDNSVQYASYKLDGNKLKVTVEGESATFRVKELTETSLVFSYHGAKAYFKKVQDPDMDDDKDDDSDDDSGTGTGNNPTPDPDPTPTPDPDPTPTPDPEPTPTPDPEPTPTPDPEPEPTPDPNPQDEINPELIYALWELTAFTVNGRIETFDPLYLNFYRDNYMASGESTEVVNKPQPFEIIGDRIYVDDNVELGIRHYMTIQQLTDSKLKFRSDLSDGTITEYAFKKVCDIDYDYYIKSVAPKKFIFNIE